MGHANRMSDELRAQLLGIIGGDERSERRVAKLAGIDPSMITHMKPEKRKADPTVATLEAVAEVCGYTVALVPKSDALGTALAGLAVEDRRILAAALTDDSTRAILLRFARILNDFDPARREEEVRVLEIRAEGLRQARLDRRAIQ